MIRLRVPDVQKDLSQCLKFRLQRSTRSHRSPGSRSRGTPRHHEREVGGLAHRLHCIGRRRRSGHAGREVTEVAGVNNPVTLFSVLYAERGSAERAVMAGIVVEATNAAAELLGDEVAEELVDVITAAVSTAVERE